MPKNERNSEILVGGGIFCILSILVQEVDIPFSRNTNPKNSTLFINSSHFCLMLYHTLRIDLKPYLVYHILHQKRLQRELHHQQ